MRERKPQATTENGVWHIAGSEVQTSLISLVVGGRFPTLLSGVTGFDWRQSPKGKRQEVGSIPTTSKGEPMKYITRIHRVEAIKYDGSNKAEIEALVSGQLENFVYLLDNGNLLVRDGTVHIGDWVVLDGSVTILSHNQFMELYEEASAKEYIERVGR